MAPRNFVPRTSSHPCVAVRPPAMQPRAPSSSDARDRATFTSRLDASALHRALALPSSAAAPDAMRAGAVSGARATTTSRGAASRIGSAGSLVDGSAARPRFAGRRRQPGSARPGGHLFRSRRRRVLVLFVGAIAALTAVNVLLLRSRNSLRAADIRDYNNEDLSDETDSGESDSEYRLSGDSSWWSWRWWSALRGNGGGQRRARALKAYNNSDPEPDARISDADDRFIDATLPLHVAEPARARTRGKAGGGKGGEGAGESGARVRLEDVLRFNVMAAGRRWDRRVGCSKFRAKHNGAVRNPMAPPHPPAPSRAATPFLQPLSPPHTHPTTPSIHSFAPPSSYLHPCCCPPTTPVLPCHPLPPFSLFSPPLPPLPYSPPPLAPSSPLQAPINPAHCHRLKLPHVTVRVENSTWLHETIIEGVHACHPCPLSCSFTRARPLATHPDALLYEGVLPPSSSAHGQPLHVYMNLEAHPANATVQATYAGHLFHWDRQRYIADNKRTDVPVFHAASNFVPWRYALVKQLMKHVPMHSFGACRSTTAQHGTELQLYPHCAHTYGAQERWQHHTHCVQSHYLFALAIENTRAPGYVTEKFFYPLEAGTVPIYIGAPDIAAFAPPDSYIDASGLSPAEVGALVKRIAADPLEYMGYHAWRRCGVYGNYSRARQMSLDTLPCRLCEHISLMGGTHHPRP
ncbi:unnamed protein product [Closterium sp. Yama58-4]|nr:unnamed protein product [Closterium sp. Yama58-4]